MRERIERVTCDRCNGVDKPGTMPFFLQTGWSPDVAGGPADAEGHSFDLCPNCMANLFVGIIAGLNFEENEEFYQKHILRKK